MCPVPLTVRGTQTLTVRGMLDAGYRTRDIVNEGNADETLVGCKEMGDLVAAKVTELAA